MGQRQPDRADLLPARRDAVEDAPRDDEMAARVVVAEGEAERGGSASATSARRRAPRRIATAPAQRARGGRYNHLFILWADSSTGSRRSRSRWAAPACSSSAFLDSSFSPLPEINDLLLIWMVDAAQGADGAATRPARRSARWPAAWCCTTSAARATSGSRGASAPTASSGRSATFQRYGVMAVLIPSLLPPPAPFKIFVLLAGVAGISVGRFVAGHRHRPRHPLLRRGAAGASGTATRRSTSSAKTAATVVARAWSDHRWLAASPATSLWQSGSHRRENACKLRPLT